MEAFVLRAYRNLKGIDAQPVALAEFYQIFSLMLDIVTSSIMGFGTIQPPSSLTFW